MPSHVSLILRRRGKYKLSSHDGRGVHRTFNQIIADVDIDTAAELIACGAADLFVGQIPASAEWLDPAHPNSRQQRALRRQAEQDFLIRCAMNAPK
jgi:hypothetical protein